MFASATYAASMGNIFREQLVSALTQTPGLKGERNGTQYKDIGIAQKR